MIFVPSEGSKWHAWETSDESENNHGQSLGAKYDPGRCRVKMHTKYAAVALSYARKLEPRFWDSPCLPPENLLLRFFGGESTST